MLTYRYIRPQNWIRIPLSALKHRPICLPDSLAKPFHGKTSLKWFNYKVLHPVREGGGLHCVRVVFGNFRCDSFFFLRSPRCSPLIAVADLLLTGCRRCCAMISSIWIWNSSGDTFIELKGTVCCDYIYTGTWMCVISISIQTPVWWTQFTKVDTHSFIREWRFRS